MSLPEFAQCVNGSNETRTHLTPTPHRWPGDGLAGRRFIQRFPELRRVYPRAAKTIYEAVRTLAYWANALEIRTSYAELGELTEYRDQETIRLGLKRLKGDRLITTKNLGGRSPKRLRITIHPDQLHRRLNPLSVPPLAPEPEAGPSTPEQTDLPLMALTPASGDATTTGKSRTCGTGEAERNPLELQQNSADAADVLLDTDLQINYSKSIASDANDQDGLLADRENGQDHDVRADTRRRKQRAREAFKAPLTPAQKAEAQARYPALDISREHWAWYQHNTGRRAQRHVIEREGGYLVREGKRWTTLFQFFLGWLRRREAKRLDQLRILSQGDLFRPRTMDPPAPTRAPAPDPQPPLSAATRRRTDHPGERDLPELRLQLLPQGRALMHAGRLEPEAFAADKRRIHEAQRAEDLAELAARYQRLDRKEDTP